LLLTAAPALRDNRNAASDAGAPFYAIERRGRHAEAGRDLSHADVGIGQHGLGGLDVVLGECRRTALCGPRPGGGQAARVRSRIRLRSNSASAPNM